MDFLIKHDLTKFTTDSFKLYWKLRNYLNVYILRIMKIEDTNYNNYIVVKILKYLFDIKMLIM